MKNTAATSVSKRFISCSNLINIYFYLFAHQSPCSSWPCQNNGTCVSRYENNSYVCVCPKKCRGKYCQCNYVSIANYIWEKLICKKQENSKFRKDRLPADHLSFRSPSSVLAKIEGAHGQYLEIWGRVGARLGGNIFSRLVPNFHAGLLVV